LDITASHERRDILKKLVKAVATEINIPFTVGGGIRTVEDVRNILRNGADKITLNTAAIENPNVIKDIAEVFGAQCVVIAIDAKRNYSLEPDRIIVATEHGPCWFEVYTYGGRNPTGLDAIAWAKQAAELGAGELLVTSMDRDGTKIGYDNVLNSIISKEVNVPLVASGGAGEPPHFLEVFKKGKADAALAASVFHFQNYPVPLVKQYLKVKGVSVRI
jgi:cyclase